MHLNCCSSLLLQLLLLLLLLLASAMSSSSLAEELKTCKTLALSHLDYSDQVDTGKVSQHLNEIVNGCQYVHGDVLVENIGVNPVTQKPIGNESMRELASDFLDSIVEISGRLRIFRVNLRVLEFKNLRAIRGYNSKKASPFFSIEFRQLMFNIELRFPKLSSVLHGNVALNGHFDLSSYCHLTHTVSWSNLFQSAEQRFVDQVAHITNSSNSAEIDISSAPRICMSATSCHSDCRQAAAGVTAGAAGGDRGMCWSPGPDGCQRRTRCSTRSCYAGTCFRDPRSGAEECCHPSCLGGCRSNGPADCASCLKVNYKGQCSDKCPVSTDYDPGTGIVHQTGSNMPQLGNICVKDCPPPFVLNAAGHYCVSECSLSEIPIKGRCNSCAAAGAAACVSCELTSPMLNEATVNQIRNSNCTVWRLRKTLNVMPKFLNSSELSVIQQMRIAYGNVMIRMFDKSLQNLSFLQNVKYVSENLYIMQLHIQYIALANLQATKTLSIRSVTGLCRAWFPEKWLREQKLYATKLENVKFDNSSSTCASAVCDQQCSDFGCWGPGPQFCVTCRNFSVSGRCVATCGEVGHYAFNDSGVVLCRPCHEQCAAGCSGPSATECDSCRSFQQSGECVPVCSGDLRPDSSGQCRSVVSANVLAGSLLAGVAALLVLVLTPLVTWCVYQRRLHRYKLVDIDEELLDPTDPSDMTQLLVVNDDDLVKQKEIGSGAFGTVYRGQMRSQTISGVKLLPVAIKVLHGTNPKLGQELLHEAKVLARVKHPNCIRLVALCLTQQVQLITALMPRGCLLKFLHERKNKLSADRMLSWSLQVADGMSYLQSLGIVHRDLAARNVLLESPDVVKITDFGLARLLAGEHQYQQAVGNEKLPVKWLGVEYFQSGQFGHQSDVWSYGVLLWEICTFGESPYASSGAHTAEQICALLHNGVRLPQPPTCSVDLYNTMLACWLPNPQSRPTFKELSIIMQEYMDKPNRYIANGLGQQQQQQLSVIGDDSPATAANIYCTQPVGNKLQLQNSYISDPAVVAAAAAAAALNEAGHVTKDDVNDVQLSDSADDNDSNHQESSAEKNDYDDDYLVPNTAL